MTLKQLLQADVYGEEFCIAFHEMLTKFVREYDDMAQMEVLRLAKELLNKINNN